MKLLKLKYNMHKFVNLIFYLIIFGIGFVLGFSVEKINFNKLISQFLFIDNVSASESYRHLEIDDISSNVGITNLQVNNGNFSFDYIATYSIIKLNPNITKIKGIAQETNWLAYKDNGDGTFWCIDGGGNNFKLTSGTDTVVRGDKLSNVNAIPSGTNITISLVDDRLLIQDDTTVYVDISDSNMIGFWVSNYNAMTTVPLSIQVYSTDNDNPGGDNTGNDNENTGDDNNDEDVEIDIVNSGFYEFAQKIFGEVGEENKFIYDFITFGLVATCFTLFILIVGYILKKFFGG